MMVEYGEQFWKHGWAPLYGVLGGNPLAAMPSLHFATSVTAAHVLATPGRSPGRSAGPTPPRSASRSSTSASTTSSTWPPGSRWPRASARRTPRADAAVAPALSRRAAGARGQGAWHDPRAGADGRRAAPPATTQEDDDRGLEFSGRSVLTLCGFLAAMIARRSTSCCRSSPAWRTRGTGSRTARRPGSVLAFVLDVRHVRRLRGDVPRRVRPRGARRGSAGARAT